MQSVIINNRYGEATIYPITRGFWSFNIDRIGSELTMGEFKAIGECHSRAEAIKAARASLREHYQEYTS